MQALDTCALFSSLKLRGLELRNRIVISPMYQGAANPSGEAGDWHLVHLGHLALGQPAVVFTEVCAVEPIGRVTYADLGIWDDLHVEGLKRIAGFISSQGVVPAIQIGHAGRKASSRRPWDSLMRALDDEDAARGESPWPTVAPSSETFETNRPSPRALTHDDIEALVRRFASAARRARDAGFRALEIHGAHGYLLHQFLSGTANRRTDCYGGTLANRMRFPIDVVEAVREVWPEDKPLFFRISAADGTDPGWTMDDTKTFVRALCANGVDVIDCSSGGIGLANMNIRGRSVPGFQVALAEEVRAATGAKVMAVGLIRAPEEAEQILMTGKADLVALGREALFNPRWPLHAAQALGADSVFGQWPIRYGWWLAYRAQTLNPRNTGAA
jgi:2,4-dienoyl-CoA reductase-like NADH-dependent reductase (Old Yellow Enzyme family)